MLPDQRAREGAFEAAQADEPIRQSSARGFITARRATRAIMSGPRSMTCPLHVWQSRSPAHGLGGRPKARPQTRPRGAREVAPGVPMR